MDTPIFLWIIAALLVAVASLIACGWLVSRVIRGTDHPFDGMGFGSFASLAILAFVALAFGLGRVEANWAFMGLVAVNLLMQPLCLYLFAACAYKLVMALFGYSTYAWRVVPPETWALEGHRRFRNYCIIMGTGGCLCSVGLSWLCLWPLL